MAQLSSKQKIFIVKKLACYDKPQAVADAFKEEFGLDIERTHVAQYDPTKRDAIGEELGAIFNETRKKFLENMDDLPLANKAVRIKELTNLYENAIKTKNFKAAAERLEQIAKEAGDSYTNKIKVAGGDKGDAPIRIDQTTTMEPSEAYLKMLGKG